MRAGARQPLFFAFFIHQNIANYLLIGYASVIPKAFLSVFIMKMTKNSKLTILNGLVTLHSRLEECIVNYKKTVSSAMTSAISTMYVTLDKFELQPTRMRGLTTTKIGNVSKGDLTITLDDIDNLVRGLTPRTHKLMDILLLQFSAINNFKDKSNIKRVVSIDLDSYIDFLGKNDSKSVKDKTRRELKDDLTTLMMMMVEYKSSDSSHSAYFKHRIISGFTIKNGIVSVNFTEEFAQYINTKQIINYPVGLLALDERSPLVYLIGRKLATHYAMTNNQKRNTHNIIKVETLLDALEGAIPSYEELMTTSRHVKQKIIAPFEAALNKLQDDKILTWEYTGTKHRPLDTLELYNNNYNMFIQKMVSFELLDYPPSPKE